MRPGHRLRRRTAAHRGGSGLPRAVVQQGPVHGLVRGEARGQLREVRVLERGNDAQVGVGRAQLQGARRASRTSFCVFSVFGSERSWAYSSSVFSATGVPPILLIAPIRASRCSLWCGLEDHRHVEQGVLQQAALRAELVGVDASCSRPSAMSRMLTSLAAGSAYLGAAAPAAGAGQRRATAAADSVGWLVARRGTSRSLMGG